MSIDVTLSPSNPEQCVSVEVVDDLAFELNESLTMSLSLLAGGLSSVQLSDILNTATIFITNNDGEMHCTQLYMTKHETSRLYHTK